MLEKDCNGNPIATFPPCYAFQMIFTASAPRLIQSISHWCLKSMKSGFARAKVPCLKTLDILSARIDAQKWKEDTLNNTKVNIWPQTNSGLRTFWVTRYIWALFEKPIATSGCNWSEVAMSKIRVERWNNFEQYWQTHLSQQYWQTHLTPAVLTNTPHPSCTDKHTSP